MWRCKTIFVLLTLSAAGWLWAGAERPPRLRVLVPAYFYPAGEGLKEWDRLIRAADKISIVAIANPNSGPGARSNSNYTEVINRAAQAGVTVIGYVSTRYGKRPRAEVEADVDRWLRFYPALKGFFFDEQASSAEQIEYYVALLNDARSKLPKAFVVTNPGTSCPEEYVSRPATDAACIFENKEGFPKFQPPAWTSRYPAERFAALPYNVPDAAQMQQCVNKAVKDRMGLLYVTDDSGSNPWDRLPTYWEAEVSAVQRVNSG
jgi:hypothetical protein